MDFIDADTFEALVTIHLSGKLARYIADNNPYPSLNALKAKAIIIDGVRYNSVNEYAERKKS